MITLWFPLRIVDSLMYISKKSVLPCSEINYCGLLPEVLLFCSEWNVINPLYPVPAVTARDKPWPFCHFWRHKLWPKLASPMLNLCLRKRFFQWYTDQSDDRYVQKCSKSWVKNLKQNPCHYTWLLHGINCLSRWCFLWRSITAAKRKEKEKKERWKIKNKSKSACPRKLS